MHIHSLPAETLLQILSDLPIQSICAFEGVSRTFYKFVGKNVDAIYKVAAVMHQFAPQRVAGHGPQAALKETLKAAGPTKWLNDVYDWKQFCKNCFLLEKSWSPARCEARVKHRKMGTLRPSNRDSERDFLVDEIESTVIFSTTTESIEVLSIETEELLWKLDASVILRETRGGFLIFQRLGVNAIDVWRRSTDCYHPDSYLPSCPTNAQIAESPDAAAAFPFGHLPLDGGSDAPTAPPPITSVPQAVPGLPRRGAYLPFTQIAYHQRFRKTCYTHPHLAVLRNSFPSAGLSTVDIWHLPTLQRLARLRIDRDIGTVKDMAVGPTHLYIATSQRIVAYDWASANSDQLAYPQFVMPAPTGATNHLPMFICERISQGNNGTQANDTTSRLQNLTVVTPLPLPTDVREMNIEPGSPICHAPGIPLEYVEEGGDTVEILQLIRPAFSDLRVSPDGNDLLVIAEGTWMVYLPNIRSRGSASGSHVNKENHGAFALAIESKLPTMHQERILPILTTEIRNITFDGNRVLISDGKDVFSFVVKDRRYLEPTQNLETNAGSLRIRPNFGICEFSQLKLERRPIQMHLLNGSAWFSPLDRHIAYVDFTDFEAMGTQATESQPQHS
ncbi:hypothetical protein FRC05_009500 [Tulasnella sp. 425]|nr:hypothetical protein FRC05_009500 [Tulasnella sp. 425]